MKVHYGPNDVIRHFGLQSTMQDGCGMMGRGCQCIQCIRALAEQQDAATATAEAQKGTNNNCICETHLLMQSGCTCGAIKRYGED